MPIQYTFDKTGIDKKKKKPLIKVSEVEKEVNPIIKLKSYSEKVQAYNIKLKVYSKYGLI